MVAKSTTRLCSRMPGPMTVPELEALGAGILGGLATFGGLGGLATLGWGGGFGCGGGFGRSTQPCLILERRSESDKRPCSSARTMPGAMQ